LPFYFEQKSPTAITTLLSKTFSSPQFNMKFNTLILSIALQISAVLSAAVSEVAAECGNLGIFTVADADLPAGVNKTEIRMCAQHPLKGHHARQEGSLAPMDDEQIEAAVTVYRDSLDPAVGLEARDCYYEDAYGCTDGFCWKACGSAGDGKWCWTASNLGFGAWFSCHTYNEPADKSPCF
jgi:hypothetical protein